MVFFSKFQGWAEITSPISDVDRNPFLDILRIRILDFIQHETLLKKKPKMGQTGWKSFKIYNLQNHFIKENDLLFW